MPAKTKKPTRAKKKTPMTRTPKKKSLSLKERVQNLNKGRILAAILVAAIGFASQMADAKDLRCYVKMNGKVVTDGTLTVNPDPRKPEGTGWAVIGEDETNSIKVFVLSEPLRVIAVRYELDVPVKTKGSNRFLDIAAKLQSSRVHTYMNGVDIDATCDEI